MRSAADLAFRQAIALCPRPPEAVFRYSNRLMQLGRPAAALMIAQVLSQLSPDDTSARDLVQRLREVK